MLLTRVSCTTFLLWRARQALPSVGDCWQGRGTSPHPSLRHAGRGYLWTSLWTRSIELRSQLALVLARSPVVFSPWWKQTAGSVYYYLHKVEDDVFISGAADGKLREPDLPAVPVVEHLQPVHHLVRVADVVVCGEVVNPAAQRLTSLDSTDTTYVAESEKIYLKKRIKPVDISSCRGGADEDLKSLNRSERGQEAGGGPCQGTCLAALSRQRLPHLAQCLTGPRGLARWSRAVSGTCHPPGRSAWVGCSRPSGRSSCQAAGGRRSLTDRCRSQGQAGPGWPSPSSCTTNWQQTVRPCTQTLQSGLTVRPYSQTL